VPETFSPVIKDGYGREMRYLRLSVTDRCNLRCRYCRVDHAFIPHAAILRYEEMERIVALAVAMGMGKVRLTGGEPFVRKGFPGFLSRLRERNPELDLRLTSNGVLLLPHVPLLREVKAHVNLSLDSMRPERFARITGRDVLGSVLKSLEALAEAGVPFKVNAVALRGVNDDELPDFLRLARVYRVDVRFIEFMPMGGGTAWNENFYWPAGEILREARTLADLAPVPAHAGTDGPAVMYGIDGGPGRLGLITPLSSHFCGTCNRLRVTSDGRLRTCLFDDREYRLAPLLRYPALDDAALAEVLRRAALRKPFGSRILQNRGERAVTRRAMTSIGG
jgi:cyclic pyranopterin phosphate synthase